MSEIKVINKDNKLYVCIPPEYKKPWWADNMYREKYIEQDDGSILFPCRNCNVTITKPIIQQTSMGLMQTSQTYVENWVYFDVPELSALVKDGDNLLESWSEEKLGLELKEELTQVNEEKGEKDESKNIS